MASVTLNVSDRHAPGVVVGAYPAANWAAWQLPPSGSAVGAATTTAVVSATGTLAFTGLADSTSYYAAKSDGVGGYVKFSTPKASSGGTTAAAVSAGFVYGGGEVVATRPGLAASTAFSAGTSQWVSNLQSVHVTLRAVTTIRLFYRNAHHETNNTNNLTLKAQISVGASGAAPFFPVFFNGSRTIVLEPGASILSDPVTVDLPSGTTFYCHTMQTAGTSQAGEKYIINHNAFLTGEFGNNTVSDQTGTQLSSGAVGGMVPTVIVAGKPALTPKAMIGLFGDSILDGKHDTNQEGWAARSLKGTYGYIGGALSSETLNSFVTASGTNSFKRRALMDGITAAITSYGINDVSAPRTLAQIQGDVTTMIALMRRAGAQKITWATLVPLTSTTDAWVTPGNQTPSAQEAGRVAFNDWLRTTPSLAIGIDYVFDAADVVEVNAAGVATRNGGRWGATFASGTSADGIHPTVAGHAALTTAFQAFLAANLGLIGV